MAKNTVAHNKVRVINDSLASQARIRVAISKKQFVKALQKLVPNIKENDLIKGDAGVRAQAMSNTGELIQDFEIVIKDNVCNVVNCPSPAATSSLSIADYIIKQIKL